MEFGLGSGCLNLLPLSQLEASALEGSRMWSGCLCKKTGVCNSLQGVRSE